MTTNNGIQTTTHAEERHGAMLFRDETWEMEGNPPTKIKAAYNLAGDYVGDHSFARELAERGIVPEKRTPTSNVCSIGFSEKDQKWFGWSHRAICGFGVGDVAKEGDCACSSGWTEDYLQMHPEADVSLPVGFVAKTLDDAKKMAIAFAEAVG